MNKRIDHIDIAKGISITLVSVYHSHLSSLIPQIIEPMSFFRMPLFFFLSGVFFSYSSTLKDFLFNKSEALLKPYFFVLLFHLVIDVYILNNHPEHGIAGVLYGNGDTIKWAPLWFLTHLFSVYCFSYLVFKFTKFDVLSYGKQWFILLIGLLIGASTIGAFWHTNPSLLGTTIELPGLPFSIDLILITSVFFISGYILKEKIINFSPNKLAILLSVLIFSYIVFFTKAHIDLNQRVYASPVFSTLGAISGIYLILCIACLIANYKLLKNIFLTLGGSSLFILIFHDPIEYKIYSHLAYSNISNAQMYTFGILAFVLSMLIPLLIKKLVTKNDFLSLFFFPIKSNKLMCRIFHWPMKTN